MIAAVSDPRLDALLEGRLSDPFGFLGLHEENGGLILRCFSPGATAVGVIDAGAGKRVAALPLKDPAGYFSGPVPSRQRFAYRLLVQSAGGSLTVEDPYRFGPVLGETDRYLLAEGTHLEAYNKMGAHPMICDGVAGVGFAVWAPNARSVSVVGNFNGWDGRRHPMRLHPSCGVWDLFLPGFRREKSTNTRSMARMETSFL